MLTRCPQCETTFRVTPEQLKARQGKVRCGECNAVFNALDTLIEEAPPLVQGVPAQVADGIVDGASSSEVPLDGLSIPALAADLSAEAGSLVDVESEEVPSPSEPDLDSVPSSEPEAAVEPASIPAVEEETSSPLDVAPEPGAEPEPVPKPEPTWESAAATDPTEDDGANAPPVTPMASTPEDSPEPYGDDTATEPETPPANLIVPADTEPSAKPEPASVAESPSEPAPVVAPPAYVPELHEIPAPPRRAWPWALGAMFGLLLLSTQLAIGLRTEAAILYPSAKPWLASLCELVGCELSLPRKVDLVGIESSDLHPGTGNGKLLLVASLRNRAPFVQEYPHLELTLTDAADAPLARRVIVPSDYLPPNVKAADGFAANADLPVNLAVNAASLAAAGYRLYLFYP